MRGEAGAGGGPGGGWPVSRSTARRTGAPRGRGAVSASVLRSSHPGPSVVLRMAVEKCLLFPGSLRAPPDVE